MHLLIAGLLIFLLIPQQAQAQSCSISVTALNFGSVDVIANAPVDAAATITVTCTALAPLRACINLGPGNGGATSAANRFLANGSNQLRYGLFTDAARSVPWGSDVWPAGSAGSQGIVTGNLLNNTETHTLTIYGRIYGGQQTALPLNYTSVFAGTEVSVRYGLVSLLLGCDLLTTMNTTSLVASATVPATCRISTSNLDFGAAGLLTGTRDASSTLTPTCTNGTTYSIGLNGGLSGASNPTLRRMSKGAETVTYGLYRDAARSQPFGSAIGIDTLGATGTGLAQPQTVYGRVTAQPTPSPGAYTDTIVATVTY